VQVRHVDFIEVNETDASDTRRREVNRRRTAETTRSDDEHRGGAELVLAGFAELREGDLAGVAIHRVYGSNRLAIS